MSDSTSYRRAWRSLRVKIISYLFMKDDSRDYNVCQAKLIASGTTLDGK